MSQKDKSSEIELHATRLPHIFHCDIHDTGFLREIAVLKKTKDGSIFYIDIEPLHQIDKARIKKAVTSQYAADRPLWEIFSNTTLSNGMNALDFFHSNSVKVKRPKGAKSTVGGLDTVAATGKEDKMIGSEFVNPAEATLDPASRVFG